MKYISLLVVACLAWSSSSADAASATFIGSGANSVNGTAASGSYIVVLKSDLSSVSSTAFGSKLNNLVHRVHNGRNGGSKLTVQHTFESFPGYHIRATGDKDHKALNELLSMEEIDYIEQDQVVTINQGSQNNPPSWGLPRVSQRGGLRGQRAAYKFPDQAGAGVTAYVIDTGINTGHVEFQGRAKMGANFVQGSPNTDENGHGSHVSGTIGGVTYGVAKKVNLVGLKVLNAQGQGLNSGIVAAMDWVVKNNRGKKAVVNMSLGGGSSRAVNDAAARLFQANVPVIVAAGNDANQNACDGSPSGAPAVFAVGASDISDNVATFSSFGKCVKIFGPGVQITSAWIGSRTARNTISGTSMATPHVVGVAALYLSSQTNLKTAAQVYQTLASTATKNAVRGNLRGSANLLVFNGAK
ncbi:subtilisin-like serine protease [Gryganskiella cystojenkinii]|nr:subtilisin-like serine protease [Gryganskiella cystojenkinii]